MLPPIPVFKDVARELGVTASHIAAPEAHDVIDSISANGHVYPQIDTIDVGGPRYKEPMLLHRNNRDGTFDEVSKGASL